ncbi:MAG TPA: helix-turn-helix domain-containing protein [Sandaracinaceae bacterium]
MAEGRFRRDLYYRLAGTVIRIPPLGERRADLPAIALTCLRRLDPSRRWSLSPEARRLLRSPDLEWPGNVRELESVLARACARARVASPSTAQLRPEHFDRAWGGLRAVAPREPPRALDVGGERPLALAWQELARQRAALEQAERAVLERAVRESGGVLAHAARMLRLPRTTLISRLGRLGVTVPARPR